jgi:phosphate-selective porin OprO/OprP
VPQVLHFGASARNRQAGNDQPLFAYGNETGQTTRAAELRLTNAPVVTGRIGEEDTFWGLEAAALWGPLSLQGEYGQLDVDLPGSAFVRNNPPGPGQLTTIANPFIGVPNPTFNAWYVEGSWFFGGHKTYEQGGGGAVQRSTTRCSTVVAAGGLCSSSGNTTCSTRVTLPSTTLAAADLHACIRV